ncbi:MAG: hypothetical protein ACRD3T_04435 [Terriglobia bacterium]
MTAAQAVQRGLIRRNELKAGTGPLVVTGLCYAGYRREGIVWPGWGEDWKEPED